MSQLNWKRVLLGGLLAGLVFNLLGMASAHLFLGDELHALHHRLELSGPTHVDLIKHLSMRFALGLILVWLYAAIRPRFGPGPRTALIASTAVWLLAYGLFLSAMVSLQLFAIHAALLALLWGFFETLAAALAGAWLYREP